MTPSKTPRMPDPYDVDQLAFELRIQNSPNKMRITNQEVNTPSFLNQPCETSPVPPQ